MIYRVVYGDDCEIVDRVNARIAEGWRPIGGVAQTENENGWHMAQAMVKDDDAAVAAPRGE